MVVGNRLAESTPHADNAAASAAGLSHHFFLGVGNPASCSGNLSRGSFCSLHAHHQWRDRRTHISSTCDFRSSCMACDVGDFSRGCSSLLRNLILESAQNPNAACLHPHRMFECVTNLVLHVQVRMLHAPTWTGARQWMARHRVQQALQRVSHPRRSQLKRRYVHTAVSISNRRPVAAWQLAQADIRNVANLRSLVQGTKNGDIQSRTARISGFTTFESDLLLPPAKKGKRPTGIWTSTRPVPVYFRRPCQLTTRSRYSNSR